MKILHEINMNKDLTQVQKDIIVGTTLGDASIISNPLGTNASMAFEQGDVHKDYLYHLHSELKSLSNYTQPLKLVQVDKRYNKENISHKFVLLSSTILQLYALLFLQRTDIGNFIKIIPEFNVMYSLLTPRTLAYWICDDGQTFNKGGLALCTDSFKFSEIEILKTILEKKFGLKCTYHYKQNLKRDNAKLLLDPTFVAKKYVRIYISGKSLPILVSLVKVDDMSYIII
jgi:hypothetical protein